MLDLAVPTFRQPVIILGMHRSGTSMLSELLDQLGLFVGHEVQGDHESTFFLDRNETLLSRVNGHWDNPLPIRHFFNCEQAVQMTALALRHDLSSRRIGAFFSSRPSIKPISLEKFKKPWGWKDPRTVFTLPLWLRLFPGARIIYILRNGVDVAASLQTRERRMLQRRQQRFEQRLEKFSIRSALDRAAYKGSARCLSLEGAFALWEEYVQQGDQNLAHISNPTLTIRYEDFLEQPKKHLPRLAEFCELANVTPAAIEKAAEKVNTGRAKAFATDPFLSAFYQTVKDNHWMVRYGYHQ